MEAYDEDIAENRFFRLMQNKYRNLYEKAADKRWTICIPRSGTFSRHSQTSTDMENHILRPVQNNSQTFITVGDKEVQVTGDIITTTNGFKEVKAVRVLFEETFFNNRDESFRILCIDQPLEGGTVDGGDQPFLVHLDSLEDCTDFLWGLKVSKRSQRQIDEMVDLFNKTYQRLEAETLRYCIDAANALFTKCVQTALKDNNNRKAVKSNRNFMDNLKVAMETYIMDGVFKKVFKVVSTFYAREDANLNKITRNLAELQLKDLGIRAQFTQNVPRARRELSSLNKYTTPLEKLYCLRRTIMTITHASLRRRKNIPIAPITTDDLLPILVFLVVKSEIANWLANLTYMQNFRFSKPANDEFGFYMASIEAAVSHVQSGKLASMISGKSTPPRLEISTVPTVQMPWQRQDSTDGESTQTIDVLFEHIKEGRLAEVEQMLNLSSRDQHSVTEKMCHPLCSCEKCATLVERKRNDPSTVTAFSRDDRGCTALHIAASYGQAKVIEVLMNRGGVMNATDYHGSTPLHLACQKGHQNATLLLLDFGANPNLADNDGNTPLHQCSANGHEDCVKAVVYFDKAVVPVDINAANLQGDTPLHHASRWGYEGIVEILLDHNASVEALNRRKETPVLCAHNVKVSRLLVKAMQQNKEHSSPSSPPIASTVLAVPIRPSVMEQIDIQVSPSQPAKPGMSEIEQAKEKQVVKLLKAVADNDVQLVRYQLGWLSDSESDEDEAMSADSLKLCHPLCLCDRCQALQRRTSVSSTQVIHSNSANHNGLTPLHIAAAHGHDSLVSLLIRRGANVNCRNKTQQCTPLHLAAQYNRPGVMKLLLNHGAKCNTRDMKGNTPLHFCCQNGHMEPAELLIKNGASINVTNQRGNTPLHEASKWNQLPLVSILLGVGANISARNKGQLTPLQCAQNDEVIEILQEAEQGFFESSGEYSTSPNKSNLSRSPTKYISSYSKSLAKDITAVSHKQDLIVKPQVKLISYSGSPTRQMTMKDMFKAFEESDVSPVQQISQPVQSFDRDSGLEKNIMRDSHLKKNDEMLKHQTVKTVSTDERSYPQPTTPDHIIEECEKSKQRMTSFESDGSEITDEEWITMDAEADQESESKCTSRFNYPSIDEHRKSATDNTSAEHNVDMDFIGDHEHQETKVEFVPDIEKVLQAKMTISSEKVCNEKQTVHSWQQEALHCERKNLAIMKHTDQSKANLYSDDHDFDLELSGSINDLNDDNVDINELEKEIQDILTDN